MIERDKQIRVSATSAKAAVDFMKVNYPGMRQGSFVRDCGPDPRHPDQRVFEIAIVRDPFPL